MLLPALSPEGFLLCEGETDSTIDRKLTAAQADGEGALLTLLGTGLLTAELEAGWRWLREWPRQFLTRLCQTRDALATQVPSLDERQALITAAPPFAGAEYLSPTVLERWWQGIAAHIAAVTAGHPEGLEGWLSALFSAR